MREIKFRAWDLENFEMFTYDHIGDIDFMLQNDGSIQLFICDSEETPECVIMQYTGCKDKSGKEIYEGDIVHADGNNSNYVVRFGSHELSSHYDSSPHECTGFYLDRLPKMNFSRCESICNDCSMLKIIGNIYQDGHLLDGKL